jgi:hypothetical protein
MQATCRLPASLHVHCLPNEVLQGVFARALPACLMKYCKACLHAHCLPDEALQDVFARTACLLK